MKLRIIIAILAVTISSNLFSQKKYTLDDCKKLTETRNINLKNSDLDILSAVQTSKEAYTKYFPEIKGSAFGFKNSRSVVSMDLGGIQVNTLKSGLTGGITAIQPIYTGGNISNSNKLAKLGEEVSKYQKEITKNDVLLETEKSFWLLASLMDKLETIHTIENHLNALLKKVESSVAAGTTITNDILKVKLKINETIALKSKTTNAMTLCKMSLCQQMGLSLDSIQTFDIIVPDFIHIESPAIYYVVHESVMYDRPEYRILDKGITASKLETKIKQSEYLPTVSIGANYGYDNFSNRNHMSGTIFATVSIPLSDLWGGSYAIKKQKIKEQIAYNKYEQGKQLLLLEMKQAQNDFDESYRQVNIAKSAIAQSIENLRLYNNYLAAGTTEISQVLDAESMLSQSQNNYTDACINYYINKAKYLQVTNNHSALTR